MKHKGQENLKRKLDKIEHLIDGCDHANCILDLEVMNERVYNFLKISYISLSLAYSLLESEDDYERLYKSPVYKEIDRNLTKIFEIYRGSLSVQPVHVYAMHEHETDSRDFSHVVEQMEVDYNNCTCGLDI